MGKGVSGHSVTFESNGKTGGDKSYTATCKCGWAEDRDSRANALAAYKNHVSQQRAQSETVIKVETVEIKTDVKSFKDGNVVAKKSNKCEPLRNRMCLHELVEYLRYTGDVVTEKQLKKQVTRKYTQKDFENAFAIAKHHALVKIADNLISTTHKMVYECRGLG